MLAGLLIVSTHLVSGNTASQGLIWSNGTWVNRIVCHALSLH